MTLFLFNMYQPKKQFMESYNEVYGTLEKLEELSVIKNEVVPGSLVFESLAPFWDYYDDAPGQSSPLYLYLGIDRDYDVFEITRAAGIIRELFNPELDLAKATISFNDRFFNVIRIRHIQGYSQIRSIQEQLAQQGIRPLLINGNWQKQVVKVQFRKIFYLSMMDEGIFFDSSEPNHYYIEVPKHLIFENFIDVTHKVKNNWMGPKFDAALGAYLFRTKVREIVRIYSEMISLEDLNTIKNLYHHKIR